MTDAERRDNKKFVSHLARMLRPEEGTSHECETNFFVFIDTL